MTGIQRIARESLPLRHQVTASLREAILKGKLKPGQKLIERELCTSLDISRTLLREALPQLQAEGLISWVAHKGPSVALVSAEEVKEIYQVRRVLEALATREFTQNASDEQIKELRQQLAALEQPEAAGNLHDLLIAKAGFYSVLFGGCGNKTVGQIVTQLNNRIVLYKRLSLSVAGRLQEVIEELEAIVTAIEARDADAASRLCEIHVMNAERTVRRRLSDEADAIPDDIVSSP
jgi:DNA-binding GntR family transcriptional regulator